MSGSFMINYQLGYRQFSSIYNGTCFFNWDKNIKCKIKVDYQSLIIIKSYIGKKIDR